MKIALGGDHGGLLLKDEIKHYLLNKGYEVKDVGTYTSDSCHYPLYTEKCAELVKNNECQFGIIVCTTGEGVAMAANKVKGIRAGIGYNDEVARLMREHNNANIMTLGAKFVTFEEAKQRVDIFLNTVFLGGRHATRVEMIEDIEKRN